MKQLLKMRFRNQREAANHVKNSSPDSRMGLYLILSHPTSPFPYSLRCRSPIATESMEVNKNEL